MGSRNAHEFPGSGTRSRPGRAHTAAAVGTAVLARLRVYGIPKPQGSKVPFVNRHTGQARMKE